MRMSWKRLHASKQKGERYAGVFASIRDKRHQVYTEEFLYNPMLLVKMMICSYQSLFIFRERAPEWFEFY